MIKLLLIVGLLCGGMQLEAVGSKSKAKTRCKNPCNLRTVLVGGVCAFVGWVAAGILLKSETQQPQSQLGQEPGYFSPYYDSTGQLKWDRQSEFVGANEALCSRMGLSGSLYGQCLEDPSKFYGTYRP